MAKSKSASSNKNMGIFLGILLAIIGFLALCSPVVTSFATIYFLGWILLIGGIARILQGLFSGHLDLALLGVFGGVLSLIVGLVIIYNPAITVATLTLLIGVLLMVSGGYRAVVSLFKRGYGWGWSFIWGILTFVIGLMIWQQWPMSDFWIIGFFVGLEFFLLGLSMLFVYSSSNAQKKAIYF